MKNIWAWVIGIIVVLAILGLILFGGGKRDSHGRLKEAIDEYGVEEPAESSGNPTYIDTVEVEARGGEYYARVTGHYPDACSETSDIVQAVEGNTIHVTIYSSRPEGMVCAQMLTPFAEEFLLDTEGLEPGEYTVIVNEDNAMTTFTLS